MSIYIQNGEKVSKDDFYHSAYNDIFISVYEVNPNNLEKAIAAIKNEGCSPTEACKILMLVLDLSLSEASMTIQKIWYKDQ